MAPLARFGANRDHEGSADPNHKARKSARGIGFVATLCAATRAEAEAAATVQPAPERVELGALVDRIYAAIRSSQMKLVSLFKVADQDDDGDLSAQELQWHLGRIGCAFTCAEAQTVVEALDADGDGGVSVEEFIAYMRGYRPGQLTRPAVAPMKRISLARHDRIGEFLAAGSSAALFSTCGAGWASGWTCRCCAAPAAGSRAGVE